MTALNQSTLFTHANYIAELNLYLFVLKNSLEQIIEAANIPEGDHYASKLSEILYIVYGSGSNATTLDEESKN
ncbi:MAG: hypothetical protein ACRCXC_09230 [Legionella sp.]